MEFIYGSIEEVGFYQFYPVIPCIVVSYDGKRLNGMTAAWHTALSFEPPLYGVSISPKRFTFEIIERAKEFTINFLNFDRVELYAIFGRISGREFNKFEKFGIETLPSKKIKTPILKDAYAAYECELYDQVESGDHHIFVGKIVGVHIKKGAFDIRGLPILENIDPAFYLGKDHYIKFDRYTIKKVGREDLGV